MKKKTLKSLAILTFSAFTIYGCASSDQAAGTAAGEGTMMSETTVAGGVTTDAETQPLSVLVVEEQITVPIATLSVTALLMENPVEVNDMFKDIDDTEKYDVLALARTSPNLSTFVKLIEQANLVDDMQRVKELTIFAPTNEAFAKMPREKLETLLMSNNVPQLSRMLQAHILSSEVSTARLNGNVRIPVSENSFIPVTTEMGGTVIRVGGARVIKDNIEGSNGMLHVVDAVILPSEAVQESPTVR